MPNEKSTHRGKPAVGVVWFLLGTLFGSGAIWQWEQAKLATEKESLDSATTTTDLRIKENALYDQIVVLTGEYLKNKQQDETPGRLPDQHVHNEMIEQDIKLRMLKDDFNSLETKLAAIENRPARNIPLDFEPPGAATLSVKAQ
jgi:hypothetical protein